jgi:predicted phosphodiesterase
MELPNIENIYQWWLIVGKPNREFIRSTSEDNLPCSKGLIENLIPYFTKRSNSRDVISIPTQDDKSESSIVVTSDWHIPFEDKEALRVFLNFLAEYNPDELVLNGNINDMTAFSAHPKLRDLAVNFNSARKDREKWFGIAELLRDILPDAKITYIGSQCHEGWLDQWVQVSPILAEDYENYSIQGWLKLADFLIDYEPEVYDVMGNNELLITHGTVARSKGGTSAYATMEMEGTSIIQGHTHRLSQVYKTTTVGETVGIECGCLCQRTPWYHLKGRRLMMDWQQGFVLLNTKGNSFSAQCIPIIRDDDDRPYFWVGKERYR